jgi:hypothetical protein
MSPLPCNFDTLPEDIATPLQALNCLAQRWPKVGGEQYEKARHLCMAALGGREPYETVRAAFVAAAEEAEVLAHRNGKLKPPHTFGNIEPR